eukprot:TRINITY_DN12815_c0_g1_i1.p1 TRINITY_DN12815_c0_g1~~TRINITY_DN12815_c0_g1_i1.p1  ORF type:complete len:233 (-),score=42.75 TRINITY_DN12815_c0_g1_i1:43-741(-)
MQEFVLKALGAACWVMSYGTMVLQGLISDPTKIYCPWPYKALSYCIVWEAAFAVFENKLQKGDRMGPSARKQKNKTRILFFAWMALDVPLLLLYLFGGNGTPDEDATSKLSFLQWIVVSFIVQFGACWFGGPLTFWFVKYFAIPYDIYISYLLYDAMSSRTINPYWDVAVATFKFVGDLLYCHPLIVPWSPPFDKCVDVISTVKCAFVHGFTYGSWMSGLALVLWTLHRAWH